MRGGLRTLGALLTLAGAALTAVGLISFVTAFNGGGTPTLFWCAMLGLPLLGIGLMLLRAGYLGAVARYVASETAPVATDALNFVAGETRGSAQSLAAAVASGLRGEATTGGAIVCAACGRSNDADANFCDQCGSALAATYGCPKCHTENAADARFCDSCGTALRTASG